MIQKIKNFYHLLQALFANIYYGFPAEKLNVIGVTGTSGKTTTTLMIYTMLKEAGTNVSVLSTLKAVIGGEEFDTGFHVTTPDPHILPKYLRKAVDNGDEYFVLEVSSHALDQNRTAFVPFKIGVLTTFAHEHLDYHKTHENYAKAKFKLLHNAGKVVVPFNGIDKHIQKVVNFPKLIHKMYTFGLYEGDQTQLKWKLKLHMPGDYNLLNALAAAAVGELLNIKKEMIAKSLQNFSGIPGRFEEVANDRGLKIIIDFAHKPDALESVLKVANKMRTKTNKIICMFGCASERDVKKRPLMGEISGNLADISVLTDEDPRREDPMKIINEISSGCLSAGALEIKLVNGELSDKKWKYDNKNYFIKIPDRQTAISFIINKLAKKGDIILLCGKGHEQSMNYNGVERKWSEHQEVKKALKIKNDN